MEVGTNRQHAANLGLFSKVGNKEQSRSFLKESLTTMKKDRSDNFYPFVTVFLLSAENLKLDLNLDLQFTQIIVNFL